MFYPSMGFIYDVMPAPCLQSHEEKSDGSGDPLGFFGVPTYLTVSGQLHAEALAWYATPSAHFSNGFAYLQTE